VEDAGWLADVQLGEDRLLWLGQLGALAEGAGWAGEHADVDALNLGTDLAPGVAVVVSATRMSSRPSQQSRM
jgi:hypothetical protein